MTGAAERITFQLWDWATDDRYTLRHFIMTRNGRGWTVAERATTLRALRRATVSDALSRAGFADVDWRMPEETGFYQPIVAASAGSDGGR